MLEKLVHFVTAHASVLLADKAGVLAEKCIKDHAGPIPLCQNARELLNRMKKSSSKHRLGSSYVTSPPSKIEVQSQNVGDTTELFV